MARMCDRCIKRTNYKGMYMINVSKMKKLVLSLAAFQAAVLVFLSPAVSAATSYAKSGSCNIFASTFNATGYFEAIDRDTARPTQVNWSKNPVILASMRVQQMRGSTVVRTWNSNGIIGEINKQIPLVGSLSGTKADMSLKLRFTALTSSCTVTLRA